MPPVLDEAQLRRIENVHGGFLYQHLYAVSILLSWADIGWQQIAVERDEDIEVCVGDSRLYIQVKKRASNLTFGDIADAIVRFDRVRDEHKSGRRTDVPQFWVISNADPGPDLLDRLRQSWPADV